MDNETAEKSLPITPTGRQNTVALVERLIDEHKLSGLMDCISEVLIKKGYETDAVHGDALLAANYRYMAGKALHFARDAQHYLKN